MRYFSTLILLLHLEENARQNLDSNVSEFNFDAVHESVRNQWNEELSRIKVEGGSKYDLKNFYTAVYRTKLMPNVMSDVNGEYRRHDMKIAQQQQGKKYYSAFSIWDTFRAWNPLQTLLDTVLVNDMINSYLEMYDASGELPIWPLSAGETHTMVGYHAVSVIADAYMKGVRGFDIHKAFEAMKVSSDINKKGSDYYINCGFIPSNIKRESVSCLLEYAYDDWCIAQVAKELDMIDDYERYTQRALSYVNVFDGHTRFFRGKRLDGNWDSPFNPFEPGRAYTEATAWQYRFFAPHDVNGMVQLFGGKEQFITQLDSLFIVEDKVHGDMVDITGLIGQYAQGNEPSHHMAYLYNYVGQPWKTQAMTRRILKEMYHPTPEGISGNEPDESSVLYEEPFVISGSVTIKAKAYKEGYEPSRTFVIQASKAIMVKGINARAKEHGVNYHYYEGYYQRVDEIEKSELKDSGIMPEPTIVNAGQEDHFAYIFSGIMYVPENGVYEFMTRSDDGSVLYVNNTKVVDNDGSHATVIATGRIALSKGYHTYKLFYFEDYEGEHLSWGWKKPSSEKYETIPTDNLFIN